jgi:hypothetical protein
MLTLLVQQKNRQMDGCHVMSTVDSTGAKRVGSPNSFSHKAKQRLISEVEIPSTKKKKKDPL